MIQLFIYVSIYMYILAMYKWLVQQVSHILLKKEKKKIIMII